MRYAIISDIHGNLPALQAVLDDIKQYNIDELIFVGDYYCDLPYPNEVTDIIRNLDKAHIVRGNKEDYLVMLANTPESEWTYDQLAPLYWNYRELTDLNLKYLMSLPIDITLTTFEGNYQLYVSHTYKAFSSIEKLKLLESEGFRRKMEKEPFTHDDYLRYVHNILVNENSVRDILNKSKSNIIIFGHSHLHWHTTIDNTLIINPGSCGLALDYDTTAAYTILEINGVTTKVIEKRVDYDVKQVIENIKESSLYHTSVTWRDIMFQQLLTGSIGMIAFFRHVAQIAEENGETGFPFSNKIWQLASSCWNNINN